MLSVWGSLLDCLAFRLGGAKECNRKNKINAVRYSYYKKNKDFFDAMQKNSIVVVYDLKRNVFKEIVKELSKKALGVELKV